MSSVIKNHIRINIENINNLVDIDFNQTIINYNNKFDNN